MSDTPPQEETPPWPTGEPDDSEPSPERQAELRAAYEANVKVGKPPYAGVVIGTRGEVKWIAQERGWSTDPSTVDEAIDLRHALLRAANLTGSRLIGAKLSSASIDRTNFTSANLSLISLSDAFIVNTNFTNADLTTANLSGALIYSTNFTSVDLTMANLSGALSTSSNFINAKLWIANLNGAAAVKADFTHAELRVANLNGATLDANFNAANLTQARMDSATVLGSAANTRDDSGVRLTAETRLLDVAWNGAILANVAWDRLPRLGDEADIKAATSRIRRVKALRDAARAYRGLAKALQAQGLTLPALKYRTREQQLERRALLYSFAIGPWLFSWLLNLVSGYGDKPGRALACYLAVVSGFAAAFYAVTHLLETHLSKLSWDEALVLSLTSFHGRGFFPGTLPLGDWAARLGAVEAIIGLFIELVFIATFTQRFFAR